MFVAVPAIKFRAIGVIIERQNLRRVGATEHLCGRLDMFRASLDRAPEDCLIVIDKDVKASACSSQGSWLTIKLVVWISDHQRRAADGDFSMKNLSLG